MEKVNSVCIRCVLILQKMHVESRLFYPTISQRSCHVHYSTCKQNVAIYSMFNIQEFQSAFSMLNSIVSKCIWHGKSACSVRFIAENARWNTGVLSEDIVAILPCTALYMNPKCSHTPYVQYTRVSCSFFKAIWYCKQVYFKGKSVCSVRCLYGIHPKVWMSLYTELTWKNRTIKVFFRYLCNKCFDTDTYLQLTASMSYGEHWFDWDRSLYRNHPRCLFQIIQN